MPLMFRCYRCNQILKTSRSKVGSVVTCPKCRVDLIVPEAPARRSGSAGDGAESARAEPIGRPEPGRIEPEPTFPDIRPEDIRVQVEVESTAVAGPIPPRVEVGRPGEQAWLPGSVEIKIDPGAASSPPPSTSVPDFPPIEIDPLPIRADSTPSLAEGPPRPRPRDIVLPRSAVVAWAWSALLGLALAFLAGLLAGHFLWAVRTIRA